MFSATEMLFTVPKTLTSANISGTSTSLRRNQVSWRRFSSVCNWHGNVRNSITLEHIHPHLPARECDSPVSTISSSIDSLSFWRRYLARKINDNFQYPAKSKDGCHEMTRPQKRQNVEQWAHHHCGEDLNEFAGHQFPSKRFPEIQTFAVLGSLQKSIGVMSSGDTHRNKIVRTLASMDLSGG